MDVVDWHALKQLYQDVLVKYGRIDVVCNNASLFERTLSINISNTLAKGGRFWADEDAESYATIDINLTSLIKSTRLAISTFLKQPKSNDGGSTGVIVNTASIAGFLPCFTAPVYAASKWGVIGFTRSLAYLHPTLNIRCVGLAPGAFHTSLWSEDKKTYMEDTEWLPLSDVANALIRCIVDESIKGGEILEVNQGGSRIMPLGGPTLCGSGNYTYFSCGTCSNDRGWKS
jgi:NAD(P)-dependent dehydrogenase (short-subunit alcohol dehydrogenase family)